MFEGPKKPPTPTEREKTCSGNEQSFPACGSGWQRKDYAGTQVALTAHVKASLQEIEELESG